MARSNRRRAEDARPLSIGGSQRRETFRGVDHLVRAVTGAGATKSYRCPGCDQLIAVGSPHVVVWPDDLAGADDRRHWHRTCWDARERRSPR